MPRCTATAPVCRLLSAAALAAGKQLAEELLLFLHPLHFMHLLETTQRSLVEFALLACLGAGLRSCLTQHTLQQQRHHIACTELCSTGQLCKPAESLDIPCSDGSVQQQQLLLLW